jgi:transcriptional regulator GlxA family with amidase domain
MDQVQQAAGQLQASPFYGLPRSHIAGLCSAAAANLTADARASLASITTHLAATLLNTTVPVEKPDQHDAMNAYLVDRSIWFMRANYSHPELSADDIAKALHVSVRHLFQLWSTRPQSLAGTLLDIRLKAACSLLETRPHMPVNTIAHHGGFADASHFSRRFRAVYGMSPTQHRRESTQESRERRPLPGRLPANHTCPAQRVITVSVCGS